MTCLTFIHGWGFDARVWNDLAGLLPQFPQRRIDLGFFGEATPSNHDDEPSVLIGHSLGFVHGMRLRKNWTAWVAINSFPRFVINDQKIGCVPASILQKMRKRIGENPQQTLSEFYRLIGAITPSVREAPQIERLRAGLDELRDVDLTSMLKTQKRGLILAAQNDPLVPVATSEALTSSNESLRWHPTGGHVLPQSAAAWCAEEITSFLHKLREAA